MVNITDTPIQVGDSFSTKYSGQATPTATDFIFPSVQDSIVVTNYGFHYITAISGGESIRIQPNGGIYRFKTDSDTVNIQSSSGATNPITIEGRSFASGQGGIVQKVNGVAPVNGNVTIPVPVVDTSALATKTELQAVASGSPKGTYATLTALQTAFPTGNSNVYLVTGNIKEVASLTVTAVPTVAGNVTVNLNGTATTIAIDPTTETTTDLVATKIRNTVFPTGAVTGGTGSIVTFTAATGGVKTDATYSAGTTGATGTMTTTTQGVDADGKWYYWSGTAWTAGGVYQATVIPDKSVTPMQANFQQIDLSAVTWTPGFYITYTNGTLATHTDLNLHASSYIPVTGGLKYIIRTCTNADLSGMAWYDASNKYISGIRTGASSSVMTDTEVTVPSNATQIRLTCYGASKLPNVAVGIKSNPLDIANTLTQPYSSRISTVENQSTTISAGLFKSYVLNSGDINDIPAFFNQVSLFGTGNGTLTLDSTNRNVKVTQVTNLGSGGAGFKVALPKLTPELLKTLKSISFEFDVDMATPIALGFKIDLYAMLKVNGSNTTTPPVTLTQVLNVSATQHVSRVLPLDYNDIVAKLLASSDHIAITDVDHFDLYVHYIDLFSNNTVTFRDMYFKLINNTDTRLVALETASTVGDGASLQPNENPLQVIKRDGGLYGILQKVAFIGDSLSSGEHEYTKEDGTGGYVDMYEHSYGQIAARATGTEAVNYSVGGLTASGWLSKYQATAFTTDQLCPAYVIYLGTNDQSSTKNPYGMGVVSTDVNKTDYTQNGLTFAGQYATIIQKIKEAQPKARIFLLTLPKGATGSSDATTNPIIRQIADLWKNEFVYLVDLQAYAPNITADYRMGGHLTTMGYMVFAWHVMSYIDYIIRKDPMSFKEVAFIGTSYHNNSVV